MSRKDRELKAQVAAMFEFNERLAMKAAARWVWIKLMAIAARPESWPVR